ncbi:MAG: hypothetical protein KGY69_19900, partial [Bacteroidales bacterium]|nr:hypothetical protein [Bacteroidales bacterium]
MKNSITKIQMTQKSAKNGKNGLKSFMPILALAVFLFGLNALYAQPDPSGLNNPETQTFEFPTSEDGANFHFTSVPDLFNWNIKYPQPGWEDAMDWFLEY